MARKRNADPKADAKAALKAILREHLPLSLLKESKKILKGPRKLSESELVERMELAQQLMDRLEVAADELQKMKIRALFRYYNVTNDGTKEAYRRLLCQMGGDYLDELMGANRKRGGRPPKPLEECEDLVVRVDELVRTGVRDSVEEAIALVEQRRPYKQRAPRVGARGWLKPRYYEAKKRITPKKLSLATLPKDYPPK